MPSTCSECDKSVHAKGLCSHHYNVAYYATNAERLRQRAADWYRDNPEKAKARNDSRDPACLRESARRYYWRNRLASIARAANQKAKRLGVAGVLSAGALEARIAFFGGCCWVCGAVADTIDHVIPLAKNGPNLPANIRPACLSCNTSRSWEGRR